MFELQSAITAAVGDIFKNDLSHSPRSDKHPYYKASNCGCRTVDAPRLLLLQVADLLLGLLRMVQMVKLGQRDAAGEPHPAPTKPLYSTHTSSPFGRHLPHLGYAQTPLLRTPFHSHLPARRTLPAEAFDRVQPARRLYTNGARGVHPCAGAVRHEPCSKQVIQARPLVSM